MAEFGKVKFFANEPEKMYGFISFEEDDVFFHWKRGVLFVCEGHDAIDPVPTQEGLAIPKTGDEVVFDAEDGPKGLRATFWGFRSDYDNAFHAMKNRPHFRLYMKGNIKFLGTTIHSDDHRLMWEGQNLHELKEQFPKQEDEDCQFKVFIVPVGEDVDEENQEQYWENCDDPRI
jgi:cold shock CspA family protein